MCPVGDFLEYIPSSLVTAVSGVGIYPSYNQQSPNLLLESLLLISDLGIRFIESQTNKLGNQNKLLCKSS